MQSFELGFFLITTVVVSLVLTQFKELGKLRFSALGLIPLGLGVSVFWLPPNYETQELLKEVPNVGKAQFTGSSACLACHPNEYRSWHDSYHRTMTQLASDKSVLAPFDGRILYANGDEHKVDRHGQWFVVDTVDPDWEATQESSETKSESVSSAKPQVRLPVVMTTGSHRLQTYWVPSQDGNKVRLFPLSYQIDTQRWIPNRDSFILPPTAEPHPQIWNNSCILCHSVSGDFGYKPGDWNTRVAELGIACEACHGPGEEHIKHFQNPLTRYLERSRGSSDSKIVNPANLSSVKSSQVCGQCHSGFDDAKSHYDLEYKPGGDFESVFTMADPHNKEDSRFWSDGSIRVGGREYSGMKESACYLRGEMSCLSCHSMHQGNPNKQLDPQLTGNQQCVQCHQSIESNLSSHTNHALDSEGSKCINCHMPYTSYALFSAIRSHRIDSPSVRVSVESGKPNACNQCHLDKSLSWTSSYLAQWYQAETQELSSEQSELPASVVWALSGNAVQRALAAWSMAWEPALEASGKDWQSRILIELLEDPYSIVRYLAANSLSKLEVNLEGYDWLAPIDQRTACAQLLRERYSHSNVFQRAGLKSLQTNNQWDTRRIQDLLDKQDQQEIMLAE